MDAYSKRSITEYLAVSAEIQSSKETLYADIVREISSLIAFDGAESEEKYNRICQMVADHGRVSHAKGKLDGVQFGR